MNKNIKKGVGKIIRFERVTKRFDDGTEALKNISVEMPANKLTVIIGPSGCGKTTFMKMINRLESPTEGDIYIDNTPIAIQDVVKLRRSIGYVIQRIGLIPHMTIEENIALVPNLLGWEKKRIKSRVNELLEMVNLEPGKYKHKYPLELSGGQQQRVGVIRALAGNPNIILMDEPFSALDPISKEQLQRELKALQRKIKKTIVFVTHDMDEALDIADYIMIMRNGQIEQFAKPDELLRQQKNTFVRDFIGAERIQSKTLLKDKNIAELINYYRSVADNPTISIQHTATVEEAIKLFERENKHCLKIENSSGEILGYLNYTDLLRALTNEEGGHK